MEPAAITEEVKKSNLRGLGGAGFPDRHEVVVHPQGPHRGPVYLVVNADEGEPGRSRTATSWSATRTP